MNKDAIIIILNIPRSYGSGDLRRFFTSFIESSRCKCFHYKRRPLQKLQSSVANVLLTENYQHLPSGLKDNSSLTNCCLVKMSNSDVQDFERLYQGKHWFGKNDVELDTKCYLVNMYAQKLDSEVLNCMEFRPPLLMPNGNVGTTTMFFMEKINSCQMPSSLISKLDLEFPSSKLRKYSKVPPPNIDVEPIGSKGFLDKETETFRPKSLKTVTGTIETFLERNSETKSVSDKSKCDNAETSEDDKYANLGEEWERHQALNDDPHSARRQLFNPDDYDYQPGTKERLFEEKQEVTWDKGSSGLVFYTDAQYWHSFKSDEERNCDDWDVDMSIYYRDSRPDQDSLHIMEMNDEHKMKNGTSKSKSVFKKRKIETVIQNTLAMKNVKDKIIHTKNICIPVVPFVKSTGFDKGEPSRKLKRKDTKKFEGNNFSRKMMEQQGWKEGLGLGVNNKGIVSALDGATDGQTSRAGLGYNEK